MMELPYVRYDPITWWRPNKTCFAQWFAAAGFSEVDVSREVMLTTDTPVYREDKPGDLRNPTQVLRVGHARV